MNLQNTSKITQKERGSSFISQQWAQMWEGKATQRAETQRKESRTSKRENQRSHKEPCRSNHIAFGQENRAITKKKKTKNSKKLIRFLTIPVRSERILSFCLPLTAFLSISISLSKRIKKKKKQKICFLWFWFLIARGLKLFYVYARAVFFSFDGVI